MKLIVGLGNPGPEYAGTRHNVGFDVLDRLARRWMPGEIARARFHGVLLDGAVGGARVMLLKPMTFMNRSGLAVQEALAYFRLDAAAALLVLVDDIALPCGTIRLRAEGSDGGHNGLADITRRIGTSQYTRLRIGIDAPGPIPQADYVLGRFRPDQREAIEPAMEAATEAAVCWVQHGATEAMNRYNRRQTA